MREKNFYSTTQRRTSSNAEKKVVESENPTAKKVDETTRAKNSGAEKSFCKFFNWINVDDGWILYFVVLLWFFFSLTSAAAASYTNGVVVVSLVSSESAVKPKRNFTFDFNPKMLNGKGDDDEDDKIAGLKS